MSHIPIKLYNTQPKEIVLIDDTHTLQQRIDEGIFSIDQRYWAGNQSSPSFAPVNTDNQLSTAPYRVYAIGGQTPYKARFWTLDSSISINFQHPFFSKIKKAKFYYKGEGIVTCNSANWIAFLYVGATIYYATNWTPYDYISVDFVFANYTTATLFLAETQPSDMRPQVGSVHSGIKIEKLKLVDIEYN